MEEIIIGTRGSELAIIQTTIVINALHELNRTLSIQRKVITTTGDKNLRPIPLDSVGKEWFTKEIDHQLLLGKIDLAVHSIKDIPLSLHPSLTFAAIMEREDAREALITSSKLSFEQLPKNSVIGTDSIRRKSQILSKRRDLTVKSIRGNIPTRLHKLNEGSYDGVILAVAGLKRLQLTSNITQIFSISEFIPSPGQGGLGIIMRKDHPLLQMIRELNHHQSEMCIVTERYCAKLLGGGCSTPIGVYAQFQSSVFTLYACIGSIDGENFSSVTVHGKATYAKKIAHYVGSTLLKNSQIWQQG